VAKIYSVTKSKENDGLKTHTLKVVTPLDPAGRLVDVVCPADLDQAALDARLLDVAQELLANRGGPAKPEPEAPAPEPEAPAE